MFVSFDVADDERMNALFKPEAKLNLIESRANA